MATWGSIGRLELRRQDQQSLHSLRAAAAHEGPRLRSAAALQHGGAPLQGEPRWKGGNMEGKWRENEDFIWFRGVHLLGCSRMPRVFSPSKAGWTERFADMVLILMIFPMLCELNIAW